jgi:hypothetical protein
MRVTLRVPSWKMLRFEESRFSAVCDGAVDLAGRQALETINHNPHSPPVSSANLPFNITPQLTR